MMRSEGFEKDQYVVYGTNGICRVEDVSEMGFITGAAKSVYYALEPVGANASTIFVPADNAQLVSKMRPLMTKKEIDALLSGMVDKELEWEEDRRIRTENFHDILTKGVTEELLLMISCIYMKKRQLMANNRKLPATDGNTLKSAEKLVEEEFSHVLGIEPEDVGRYIRKMLDVPETDD